MEVSIKMLMDSYRHLEDVNKYMYIVPVMVSYDRVFENMDISTEMLTAEHRSVNLLKSMRYIQNFAPDKLGEVFVKYCEPINIHDFLTERGFASLNQ